MKKRIVFVFVAVTLFIGLSACKGEVREENDSNKITMYLWDFSMTKELTPWLEKQFPEMDF